MCQGHGKALPVIHGFCGILITTGRASPVYRLPGLSHRAADAVVVELATEEFPDWHKPVGRPRKLTLVQALRLTLCRLRRNATYQDLHEDFDIGRTTAWDYHQDMVDFNCSSMSTAG